MHQVHRDPSVLPVGVAQDATAAEAAPRYRRFVHWLLDPDTGKPWGVAANVGVSFDLVTRKLTELSGEDLAAHQSLVVPGFVI